MKILAVDDEPLLLEAMETLLAEHGYTDFVPAFSGQAALREIDEAEEAFDCILLDIRMPGMDGVDLCRAIRAIPRYRKTPIMMVTSMTDREYIDGAFLAGATDYVNKPLDPIELKARMSVMGTLIEEQARSALLEQQAGRQNGSGDGPSELAFALADPVPVQGYDRLVECRVLENYLLRLSVRDQQKVSAFVISISNAEAIFAASSPVSFLNMLADVAFCIECALERVDTLVSYAGNGIFVVVPVGGKGSIDHAAIRARISTELEGFTRIYQTDHLPMPEISIGPEVSQRLFSRFRAPELIDRAIEARMHGPDVSMQAHCRGA